MANRDLIIFQDGKKQEIELIFDTPLTGNNRKGEPYNLYAFKIGNVEFGCFAEDELHDELIQYGKGNILSITKMGKSYKVEEGNYTYRGDETETTEKQGGAQPDWDKINADKTKDIHRQVCLKLAVQSIGVSTESMSETIYDEIRKRMDHFISILDPKPINPPF